MIWAPNQTGTIKTIARAVQHTITHDNIQFKTHILVPLPPYLGIAEASHITDVWTHELLRAEWDSIANNVQFLYPPSRCIFNGSKGPLHQIKSYAIITLGMAALQPTPTIWQYREVFTQTTADGLLVIDVPKQERIRSEKALHKLIPDTIGTLDGPHTSFASAYMEKRGTYYGAWSTPARTTTPGGVLRCGL